MSHPIIDLEECTVCGICVDTCQQGVLDIVGDVLMVVNEDACIACAECMDECPMGAITEIDEE